MLNSVEAGDKSLTVKWGGSKNFTGYEVQIATDEDFTKNVHTQQMPEWKPFDYTFRNLQSGTYYARVRSYHVLDGEDYPYYGEWSNVLSAQVK